MINNPLVQKQIEAASEAQKPINLKRQVTMKTIVTDSFRERASRELSNELQVIDTQMTQLEAQYQHSLQQLEQLAQQGQNVRIQLDQLNMEAQGKRNQLSTLKMEVSNQLANLERIENGAMIVTGVLESFVEVSLGDNIYEKMQNTEIIVENGIITAIR